MKRIEKKELKVNMNITSIKTLGELKKSGYKSKSIKDELRDNLIDKIKNKETVFTGVHGYEDTVIPELERAILSRHNINLLGLRGQAKTRLARLMLNLLDEYIPIVEGSEINDDPLLPISRYAVELINQKQDKTPISWLHRNNRFAEKLVLESYLSNSQVQKHILVLNSPNNPTGAVYSDSEYQSLATVCRKHKILVLSDEIYSQINFSNEYSPSISRYYSEGTIVFGGLSKVFSAGGYRLGFMSLPKELEKISVVYSSLFSETFSCVSSPVQFSAIKAYEYAKNLKEYVASSAAILDGISTYIFNELSKCNIQCTTPQGSFYMMVGFEKFKEHLTSLKIDSSTKLSHHLLKNYGVALLPGSDFGFHSNELFFRMAFVDFDGEKVMEAYKKEIKIDELFIKENCLSIYKGVQQLIKFTREIIG